MKIQPFITTAVSFFLFLSANGYAITSSDALKSCIGSLRDERSQSYIIQEQYIELLEKISEHKKAVKKNKVAK
jgi:hypothetical protein